MSREIKFRVWDKESRAYYPIAGIDPYGRICIPCGAWTGTQNRIESCDSIVCRPGKMVLEQYTGLKDKNGKEIYEGDIVMWTDDNTESGSIVFDEGCFYVNWPICMERIDASDAFDLEVIGNIHENPELLEGNSDED